MYLMYDLSILSQLYMYIFDKMILEIPGCLTLRKSILKHISVRTLFRTGLYKKKGHIKTSQLQRLKSPTSLPFLK